LIVFKIRLSRCGKEDAKKNTYPYTARLLR